MWIRDPISGAFAGQLSNLNWRANEKSGIESYTSPAQPVQNEAIKNSRRMRNLSRIPTRLRKKFLAQPLFHNLPRYSTFLNLWTTWNWAKTRFELYTYLGDNCKIFLSFFFSFKISSLNILRHFFFFFLKSESSHFSWYFWLFNASISLSPFELIQIFFFFKKKNQLGS